MMLLLRQLTSVRAAAATGSLTRYTPAVISRFYASKKTNKKMSSVTDTAIDKDQRQIHKETLRHINPNARITIKSDIYVKVQSADVHDYPSGDVLIAELHGGHVHNSTASLKVQVSDDEKSVDVTLSRIADYTDFHCEMEVPIRATLYITGKDGVAVKNMHSSEVNVLAVRDIKTKEINADKIMLQSQQGNIKCEGRLLGKDTTVETQEKGNISLDKSLGDKLICKTDSGSIKTNSCYANASKFETNTGSMHLKNVHNKSEVWVHQKGDLQMSGVHGNLNVRSNGGSINLQLSQLQGESAIVASGVKKAIINISEEVEKTTNIEANVSGGIVLESGLRHLREFLADDKEAFLLAQKSGVGKLKVFVEGSQLQMGKSSWADTVSASMNVTPSVE